MTEAAIQSGSVCVVISDEVPDRRYARVRLASDLGEAVSRVYALEVGAFLDDLGQLDRTLSGSAKLESLEGDFSLELTAQKLGHIGLNARLSNVERSSDFFVSGQTDQSCLPDFIRSCRALQFESILD